jgi:anti-anti-sigma factor
MKDLATVDVVSHESVTIVRIRGEIDLSNADDVLGTIERAFDETSPGLVVDLSELEYVDSAGVRLLFRAARLVTSAGGRFVAVVAPGSHVLRVLELAETSSFFPLEESEDAAVARVLG